ncbi:hypothetical protein P7D22_13620 [Lichenihabitans sp. Uapishka_5]|uniref:hypothetical protein n=1 Tax=Lichenihabitans sp. Uapishka_5 TaxID=3037302 RepID=UPI0029E8147C|nr:hypothetical protein [Lichenihabitans sp. Uapishka_5]MDX7952214.1 hypothetical protein [Lichenihabitans sp. Uapishka_5]
MKREERIALLTDAERRLAERFNSWTENPQLKISMRESYEKIQEMKNPVIPKRA